MGLGRRTYKMMMSNEEKCCEGAKCGPNMILGNFENKVVEWGAKGCARTVNMVSLKAIIVFLGRASALRRGGIMTRFPGILESGQKKGRGD